MSVPTFLTSTLDLHPHSQPQHQHQPHHHHHHQFTLHQLQPQPQPQLRMAIATLRHDNNQHRPTITAVTPPHMPLARSSTNVTLAHVLHTTSSTHPLPKLCEDELCRELERRLATLGIGPNLVQVEIRLNKTMSNETTFRLILTGNVTLNVGSLFNIMIFNFLHQHPQITQCQRRVTFVRAKKESATANTNGSQTSTSTAYSVDSAAVLNLKVKHLAKLLTDAKFTLVYAGDQLLQGVTPSSTSSSAESFSSAVSDSSPPTTILNELSASQPPVILADWVRQGVIQHIVNENTDGWFNPRDNQSKAWTSNHDHLMSNEGECSSSQSTIALTSDEISEVIGNKYKEVCSSPTCSSSGCYRDYEVALPRLPKPVVLTPSPQPSLPFSSFAPSDSHQTGRFCSSCNSPLRDTLIEWNESVPSPLLSQYMAHAARADLSIVFGATFKAQVTRAIIQQQSPSVPIIIVSPYESGKDILALESGGIIIRREPIFVIDALKKEYEALSAYSSTRSLVPSASTPSTSPKLQPMPISMARRYMRASSLTNDWNKLKQRSIHVAHSLPPTPPSSSSPIATQAHVIQSKQLPQSTATTVTMSPLIRSHHHQRRMMNMNRSHPIPHWRTSIARPGMSRASTAPQLRVVMMKSLALPPFPSLDDEGSGEGDKSQVGVHPLIRPCVPSLSSHHRSQTEQPTSSTLPSANLFTSNCSMSTDRHPPTSSSSNFNIPLTPPMLPTVSSPVAVERYSSLSPPPCNWNEFSCIAQPR